MEIPIDPKFNIHSSYRKVNIINPYRYGSGSTPPVGGIDPDYQAVLDFASNNSIAHPDTAQQAIDNQRMIDIKATGLFNKADVVLNFESTAPVDFRLICWKRKIKAVAYGSGVWSNQGWKGNGSNTYIDPLYNPGDAGSLWTKDSAGIIWKAYDLSTTSGNSAILGGYGGSLSQYTLVVPNGTKGENYYLSIQDYSASQPNTPWGRVGLNGISRISATQIQIHNQTPIVRVSTNPWLYKLFIGARNRVDQGGTADLFTREGFGFVAIGGNIANEYTALKAILE